MGYIGEELMGQTFLENAHNRIDLEEYGKGWEHIYAKDKCPCEECEKLREENKGKENDNEN